MLPATVLSAWVLSGCRGPEKPDPASLYQGIYEDFVHGSLDVAQAKAEKGRREFSAGNPRGDPVWELKFRLLEAEILFKRNRLDDTIALLAGRASFPDSGDVAIKRDLLLGLCHFYLGRSQESSQELSDARRLAEASHSALIGEVLRADATVQRRSGNLDQAREIFKSSLAVAREHRDVLLEANDLVDLGLVSLQSERYDEAVVWSDEAKGFAESIQARRQLQWALGNRGWAYVNLGDFERALEDFRAAASLAEELRMSASRVLWLQNAGLADYELGNAPEARTYDEQALQLALTLPASDETDQIVNIEANLALLLVQQAQYDDAKLYGDKAVRAARDSKDDKVVAYAGFIDGLIATHFAEGDESERRLMHAWQSTPDSETRMEIENALAKLHAGNHQSKQAENWYRRSIETFEQNRSSVRDEAHRLSVFSFGDTVYRDYADFLIDARRPGEALWLLDRSRARTLEEGLGLGHAKSDARGDAATHAPAVARRLGATILFYSLGPQKSYLWATTGKETRLFVLPGQRDIQPLVDEYQRAIQKSIDPLQTANRAATALYDVLVKPAAAMIPLDAKVFVIPDGVLNSLNFETLLEPTAEGYKYWIEEVTLATASSIRILSGLDGSATAAAARDLLLIGDPVSSGSEFDPLPNAAAEIERVQRHFPVEGRTVVTQARAVPAAYGVSAPEQFKYIHFVAHGTASRSSPLDSAVVLSPTPANPDDFKLYAREIVRHPLHARLVTVSACYGSGVRSYAGEGLVGLAWAFLRAGSHHVISALWQADDAATPLLMDRLYAGLEAGQAPDAALRTAKLWLIHSANVYRKPLYWGAFQLYTGG
jgi:CHAT domain-containing protein